MTQKTVIEISDFGYCIKLSKNDFDVNFIKQLIKRLQTEIPATESGIQEDDFTKRKTTYFADNFDDLADK